MFCIKLRNTVYAGYKKLEGGGGAELFGFLYQSFLNLKVGYKKVFWKIFLITEFSGKKGLKHFFSSVRVCFALN